MGVQFGGPSMEKNYASLPDCRGRRCSGRAFASAAAAEIGACSLPLFHRCEAIADIVGNIIVGLALRNCQIRAITLPSWLAYLGGSDVAVYVRRNLRLLAKHPRQRFAAGIVGSGTLDGWTVIVDAEVFCADPIADATRHEIQCVTRT